MDEALVRHIARLARIELGKDELERLAPQLSTIIGYFDTLREIDTTDVEPLVHAVEDSDVLAADEPGPSLPVETALGNAPRQDGSFFCVPRVVGADS